MSTARTMVRGLAPLAIAALGLAAAAPAQPPTAVAVHRATSPVVIDGILDEAVWREATPVRLAFEVTPGNNTPAAMVTECFSAVTDDQLLFACRAFDSTPSAIRAFYSPRDLITGQDRIGVVLDPFNDSRRAFEFAVTPLGVQSDGVFEPQLGAVDASWDAIWESAGQLDARGYSVELAIPFKSIPFPRAPVQQPWGFYVWRATPRSVDVETRSVPLDRRNGCVLCQAGSLTGLRGISPGLDAQLTPTLTSLRTDTLAAPSAVHLAPGELASSAGLDARWSPSPNVRAVATLNPDFSQVEADVAQLDVNNRFTLFFPEKRPFFLDGAEMYATPLRAVFTRSISNPTFGTQVNGKVGRTAFTALVAGDRVNNLLLPGNQGSSMSTHDGSAATVVARVRRDVGASSTLGLLYTDREGDRYHNRAFGADGLLQLARPVTLRLQILGSKGRYDEAFALQRGQPSGDFGGVAAFAQANYDSRSWRGQALVRAIDPGFRADAGFVEQVDVQEVNAWGQRQFWGQAGDWFSRINLTSGFWDRRRFDGLPTERVYWGNVLYRGPRLSQVFIDHQRRREYYQGRYFDLSKYHSVLAIAPNRELRFSMDARWGDAIDLANAIRGSQAQAGFEAQWRAGRHLDLNASYAVDQLATGGKPIVTSQLPQLSAEVNFSAQFFVRLTAQYRVTERNGEKFAAAVGSRHEHLFTRALFSFQANPQTLVYVGYSDERDGLRGADGNVTPLAPASRSFFLKLSYAWRP